jgi:hypothetical protein
MVIQDWYGSLAVASTYPILKGPVQNKAIHEITRTGTVFLFVPFRVNSWILLVQAEIDTKAIKSGLTRLLPQAVPYKS